MGYTVDSITLSRQYILANGVALFLVYTINFLFQMIATCCPRKNEKWQSVILERLLQNSRVLYWFGIATMFSVYPPFYHGVHSAIMGWITLIFVFFMHVFAMVRKCDQQRSVWSYFYYFYHLCIGVWMITALIIGYIWSGQQDVPSDSQQF